MGQWGRWSRTIVIVVTVAVVALAGTMAASGWMPSLPADGALSLVARTSLGGEIAPDATDGVDPASIPRSPAGSVCLDPIGGPVGSLALCWEAYRDPYDTDPARDDYRLRVYGTFGGAGGTGIRWVVVRARLVGARSGDVLEGWPTGVYDGPCRSVDVALHAEGSAGQPATQEILCGRTLGSTDAADWSQRVAWTCVGCLLAGHEDRVISLHAWVEVPEGTIPAWEIFADLGD